MSAMDINPPQLRSYHVGKKSPTRIEHSTKDNVAILERMKELGLSRRDFRWSEAKYLPQLINPVEQLGGVVVGKSNGDHALLAATDHRILYLDTKPLYVHSDDISYDVIGGVQLGWIAWAGTLILHTAIEDFTLRVTNRKAAEIFRSYVEQMRLGDKRGRL